MSTTPISVWHKILEAVDAGRIVVAGGIDLLEPVTEARWRYAQSLNYQFAAFGREAIAGANDLNPTHFVISDRVMEMVSDEVVNSSVAAMHKAGVANKLPVKNLAIEWTVPKQPIELVINGQKEQRAWPDHIRSTRSLVLLTETGMEDQPFVAFGMQYMSLVGYIPDLVVIDPGVSACFINVDEETQEARVGVNFIGNEASKIDPVKDRFVYQGAADRTSHAIIQALALLYTKGLAREVISPNKINKARVRSNKHPIPDHIVLRIGAVYDRGGNAIPVQGERVPREVHLRRAHNRRVAVGEGRTGREWRHFPAVLVNYKDGDELPKLKNYLVKE